MPEPEGLRLNSHSHVPSRLPPGERNDLQAIAPTNAKRATKERRMGVPPRRGISERVYPPCRWEVTSDGAGPPNGSRLSCGAPKKNSFLNLRAPPASSAC